MSKFDEVHAAYLKASEDLGRMAETILDQILKSGREPSHLEKRRFKHQQLVVEALGKLQDATARDEVAS